MHPQGWKNEHRCVHLTSNESVLEVSGITFQPCSWACMSTDSHTRGGSFPKKDVFLASPVNDVRHSSGCWLTLREREVRKKGIAYYKHSLKRYSSMRDKYPHSCIKRLPSLCYYPIPSMTDTHENRTMSFPPLLASFLSKKKCILLLTEIDQ